MYTLLSATKVKKVLDIIGLIWEKIDYNLFSVPAKLEVLKQKNVN